MFERERERALEKETQKSGVCGSHLTCFTFVNKCDFSSVSVSQQNTLIIMIATKKHSTRAPSAKGCCCLDEKMNSFFKKSTFSTILVFFGKSVFVVSVDGM